MAMIARVEGNDQTLFHKTNSLQPETVWQKMQKGTSLQKDDDDTVIGKAAEVFISKEGRKLYADSQEPLQKLTQTDFMTEGEKKLNELLAKKAEREECNKRADELEERLNSETDTLTDKEKEDLQAEIDELREKGKSPDQKLHEMYQKKFAIEDEMAAEHPEFTPSDELAWLMYMQTQLNQAVAGIEKAKDEISAEGMLQEAYTMQILLERGELAVAKNRADYLGAEIDFRSSELSMSVRTDEQIKDQAEEKGKRQPTAADVVQAAVEEGKAKAEKADTPIGKLANSERDTALTLQEKISPITDNNLTGEDTKKIIKQAEKIKKITLEDALT